MLKKVFSSIVGCLNANARKKGALLLALSLFTSILDIFGLASLVPAVLVIAEPGGIFKNKWTASIYDLLGFGSEKIFLLVLLSGFLLFFIVKTVVATYISYIQAKFTGDLGYGLVTKQINRYISLNFLEFTEIPSSRLIVNGLDIPFLYVQNILRPSIILFTESVICLIVILGIAFYKPLLLVLLSFVLLPICLLTYRFVRKRMAHLAESMNTLRVDSLSKVSDLFSGFIELKLANKQKEFSSQLFKIQREFQDLDAKNYLFGQIPARTIELAAIIGVLIIFLYAVVFNSTDSSLLTLIGLFAAAAYRLIPSLNRVLTVLVQYKNYGWVIDEIDSSNYVMQKKLILSANTLPFTQSLVFKNIYFKFPASTEYALNNVSLAIKKGEKVGFIGSSGSGKTTLMNLLLRFYTEDQGNIIVDGTKLGEGELNAWHQLIGYVKQDTFLMQASIKDNITLGEKNPDLMRLTKAVDQASLKSLVDTLPNQLDTMIGERGSKLSGGQRQRIGIARALYKQAEVLILDEATSALDNETEREVSEAINHLSETDMTILIVAHRITTLRECDRIYELKNGSIVAEHQYENLIARTH